LIESRFFTEDIPFGLCILRNIGDLLGIELPFTSKLILWHQKFMNKEYLKEGYLNKDLFDETGIPSRYGINDADKLVEDYL
jgi:opine dehydrogenase